MAQHITRSDDSLSICHTAAPQGCEQILMTRDGGRSYAVARTKHYGTSGNFNGYGDLGTLVPPASAGRFRTIVGCNDCANGGLPYYVQTWQDADGELRLVENRSVTLHGSPPALRPNASYFGLSTPSQSIVRLRDGALLMAIYGFAADGVRGCEASGRPGRCYTIGFYRSADDGLSWEYRSRLDQTKSMPLKGEGPCEPGMVALRNGTVLLMFRLGGGLGLWRAYTEDGAAWSEPEATPVFAVWPQLLLLSNGALVLGSGRPGLGLWRSPGADGAEWVGHDVIAEHNSRVPPSLAFGNSSGTTAYTGIAEVEPGVVLLAYDKIGKHRAGGLNQVFSVRVRVGA